MPDWSSAAEVLIDSEALVKLTHALAGLYVWEWFLTVDFEFAIITRKRPARWPIIFYFLNRYLLLFALIGILVSFDTTTEINCQALFTFNQLAGNAAVGLASINLCLRTLAVYRNSRTLTVILVLVIFGHWSLILQAGTLFKVEWSAEAGGCEIVSENNRILAATFIYSMLFDLLVFVLNAYKLWSPKRGTSAMGGSRLARMLFTDGLVYFFIAFLFNLMATVFMLLNLNSVMTVMFNVPAVIASTIVACRVVRRLSNFTNEGPEMFNSASGVTAPQFHRGGARPNALQTNQNAEAGVHVQMETYTHRESFVEASPHSPVSPTGIGLQLRFEDTELKTDDDSYDVEANLKAEAL